MRCYEIDGDRILVDGVDTEDMTRAELRRRFSMVPQETWLFQDTIHDAAIILYMVNGDIEEVGDRNTRMQLNGKYTALYNSQFV